MKLRNSAWIMVLLLVACGGEGETEVIKDPGVPETAESALVCTTDEDCTYISIAADADCDFCPFSHCRNYVVNQEEAERRIVAQDKVCATSQPDPKLSCPIAECEFYLGAPRCLENKCVLGAPISEYE